VSAAGREPGEANELIADLKRTIAKSVAGNVELAGRVRDLVRELAADAPAAVRDARLRNELLARWLTFNVITLRALTESSLETMNGIVTAAELTLLRKRAAPGANGAGGAPAVAEPIDLVLQGRRGERVSAPFLLENHYDRALDVAFEAEPFRAAGRPELTAALLVLEPGAVTIPARGQTIVHAAVDLVDDFAAGVTYATVIRLIGYEAKAMRLSVRVTEPVAESAAPPRQARRKRSPRT
jgi:hypothetical protein